MSVYATAFTDVALSKHVTGGCRAVRVVRMIVWGL